MGSVVTLRLWGFAVAAAFVPGMYAAPFLPRWWAICLGLVFVPRLDPRTVDERMLWAMGIIVVWSALTLLWSPALFGGAFALFCLGLFAVVAIAAANLKSQERDQILAAFGWGVVLSTAFGVAQKFGYQGLPQSFPPGGLFYNPEVFAEAAAPIFVWALFSRRWTLTVCLGLGVAICHEHIASFIAIVGVICFVVRPTKWQIALIALAILIGIISLATRPGSADTRLLYWATALRSLSFAGGGLGWWFQAHPFPFEEYVHSDLLQAGVEIGLAALLWPLVFVFAWHRSAAGRAERALLLACVLECVVSFALHMPATLFLCAVATGAVACRDAAVRVAQPPGRDPDAVDPRWQSAFGRRLSDNLGRSGAALSVRSALARFAHLHPQADRAAVATSEGWN